VSYLVPGIYFLKVAGEDKHSYSFKFIKTEKVN